MRNKQILASGKKSNKGLGRLLATTALTAASLVALSNPAKADPRPWSEFLDEHGNITIDLNDPYWTNIFQHTDIYVGISQYLNIPAGYTVNIIQPNANSIFAAKAAYDADPTRILGALHANGNVIIIDRNGIFFGADSVVDANGLIATTGDISTDQIVNNAWGAYTIDNIGADPNAKIDLRGRINIAQAGLAAFVAPTVTNSGVINARYGKVGFASGEKVTIDPYGDQLFEIEVPGNVAALLENTETGQINAEGGMVAMSAATAEGIVDNMINVDGVVTVGSASVQGGKIVLSAGNGTVNVKGTVDASGTNGGSVSVKGKTINVENGSTITADSNQSNGAAGTILAIAGQTLNVNGSLSARGRTGTGYIDTSAPEVNFADTASILTTGEWLLDPTNITIDNVLEALLEGQLAIGNATITTPAGGFQQGNITVLRTIDWSSAFTLTMNALGSIIFNGINAGLNATGLGNAILNAGNDIRILAGNGIRMNGGFVTFNADDEFQVASGQSVNTNGGTINVNADAFDLDGFLNAGAGAINITRDNDPGSFDDDTNIDVGDSNGSNFRISQSELNRMTAGTLTIGSTTGANNQISVDNADFRRFNQTVLNTRRDDSSNDQDVLFRGTNFFNALTVNADDDIVIGTNAIVNTFGNTIFNTDTNAGGVGNFNMNSNSRLNTNGFNLTVNTIGVNLGSNAIVNAAGGNIDFNNTGIFSSVNSNSVRTTGTGTIDINQSVGGLIQNAIDAVENTGTGMNTIHVGAGTFNENINIYENNFTLLGANSGINAVTGARVPATIINGGAGPVGTAYGFKVTSNNVTIDGFDFNGDGAGVIVDGSNGVNIRNNKIFTFGASDGYDAGVQLVNASNVVIENNDIDSDNDGVNATGGSNITVRNNRIHDVAQSGIDFSGVGASTISGNIIYNSRDHAIKIVNTNGIVQVVNNLIGYLTGGAVSAGANNIYGDGVYANNANGIIIQGNKITDTARTGVWDVGSGIQVVNTNGATIGGLGALGNIIRNAGWDGIRVANSSNITIQGNDIFADALDNGARVGIYLGNVWNSLVSNNIVRNANRYAGIYAQGGGNHQILGNTIETSDEAGILVRDAGGTTLIDNNIITNSGLAMKPSDGSGSGDGILVSNTSGLRISNNTITNAYANGIKVISSAFAGIVNNIIHNVGGNGIDLFNTDNIVVFRNTISNATRGINLHDSGIDNADIDNNTIRNVSYGIYADGVSRLNIEDNFIDGRTGPGKGLVGIYVNNSFNARIGGFNDGNTVEDFATGIQVFGSNSADIEHNIVREFTVNGIQVSQSDFVDVKNNIVYDGGVDANGILVSGSDYAEINNNSIRDIGGTGIYLILNNYADVFGNNIRNIGRDGIFGQNVYGVDIWGNRIANAGGDGIDINDGDFARIWLNDIYNVGDNGIELYSSDNASIASNSVDRARGDGINVVDSFNTDILFNSIYNVRGYGIFADNVDFGDIRWNLINTAGLDGIHVNRSRNIDIVGNTVINAGDDGIDVRNSRNATIANNVTFFTGGDGIQVRNSNGVDIFGNWVLLAGDDGIDVEDSRNASIRGNVIRFVNNNGIEVENSFGADILDNNIAYVFGHGIYADNIDSGNIRRNDISHVARDGIHVFASNGVRILNNDINFTGDDGIDVRQSDDADIRFNNITETDGDGIHVRNSDRAIISNNFLRNIGDDGIDLENSFGSVISTNDIRFVTNTGVEVENGEDVTVSGNTVRDTRDGIVIDGSTNVRVLTNTVTDATRDGIAVAGSTGVTVDENTVTDAGRDALSVIKSNLVTLSDNIITGAGRAGIYLASALGITINDNEITDSGEYGLFASGPSNGLITLAGNTFTNNPVGAFFESGSIDISNLLNPNTFTGGDVAMRFSPFILGEEGGSANLNLVGNTLGSTIFQGQTTFYVELLNGALFNPGTPTIIDGRFASFDGIVPNSFPLDGSGDPILPADILAAIESKLFDFDDLGTVGQIFVGRLPALTIENFEDFLRQFGAFDAGSSGLNIRILGLPRIFGFGGGNLAGGLNAIAPAAGGGTSPEALANIAPAAGGNDQVAQNVANIEPAAGGENEPCLGQAVNDAIGGTAVNYSFGGTFEESIASVAACGIQSF